MLGIDGMALPRGERYAMADEYRTIRRRRMDGKSVTDESRRFQTGDAKLPLPIGQRRINAMQAMNTPANLRDRAGSIRSAMPLPKDARRFGELVSPRLDIDRDARGEA